MHPEGPLNDGAIMTQVHFTMQSLVFGEHSLVNRIKAALRKAKRDENDWTQYLTLLNLRNWAMVGKEKRYVTEQVYVHTKLMIVDDCYVVMGSANVNDRSLLGTRDSELGVLVFDNDRSTADLRGNGKPVLVRNFARELRQKIWRKLFGLEMTACPAWGGAGAATELAAAVDAPASPASWKAIQERAKKNAAIYEAVFDWVPRSNEKALPGTTSPNGASIWPRWKNATKPAEKAGLVKPMPFQPEFWDSLQAASEASSSLAEIKGFISWLPTEWTKDENNNWNFHSALITHRDVPATSDGNATRIADNTPKTPKGIV